MVTPKTRPEKRKHAIVVLHLAGLIFFECHLLARNGLCGVAPACPMSEVKRKTFDPTRTCRSSVECRLLGPQLTSVNYSQRALKRPDLGRRIVCASCRLKRRAAAPFGCTAVARRIPGRYRHVIPYSSIIRPFSPSYGHSLDKTARSVRGWSTRRIVDRHHRMLLDGKERRQ
jgi:hypothetical protein